ncbi:MAG: ThuA domain-containing protein [Chitinophagaceae bacterium]|nr:ThuA domain-containing protein [Chitinophagaceae bacterium]
MPNNRRDFLKASSMLAAAGLLSPDSLLASPLPEKKIRVLVWDETGEAQKQAYENFLGRCIADQLSAHPALAVNSATLDDPEQGIGTNALNNTDVLIWWGHIRHGEIPVAKGQEIAQRIASGALSFIGLHSAHWSVPFIEAMNEVTKRKTFTDYSLKKEDVEFIAPEVRKSLPKRTDRISPYTDVRKFPDESKKLQVYLPNCCFPDVANDGKPSTLTVQQKNHPIVKGLEPKLHLSKTEMYNEPFHVPEPNYVLLEECWDNGEWFRSGMLWQLGKGRVFYFRPGHETYPIFKEKWVMQLLTNAVLWMAESKNA